MAILLVRVLWLPWGCNLRKENVEKGIRYSGIKLSDPSEEISGVFDRHARVLT